MLIENIIRATTHTDLSLRARQLKIPTRTLPNASILTGIGATGLSLYNFGQTISMVWFTDNWRPTSWYPRLQENVSIGLHTLILLDIKVKEPDLDVLARTGRMKYLPPRFMSVAECAKQLVEVEEELKGGICGTDALAVGVSRVGSEDMQIVAGTLEQLCDADLGRPLHSLVLVGRRGHELERDFLEEYAIDKVSFKMAWDKSYGKQT
jgi:diphthine synthase